MTLGQYQFWLEGFLSASGFNITKIQEQVINEKICRNCEYYDFNGNDNGDCHNSYSPRFTPPFDFTCNQFYPLTTEVEE